MDNEPVLLNIQEITKSFPGVIALSEVSLQIRSGQVHVLLGENGAGKSTLIKIITGVYPPNSGSILIDGEEVEITGPDHALHLGISSIFQDPSLVPYMSVEDNIMLGREPAGRLPGFVDRKEVRSNAEEVLALVGLDIDPRTAVGQLSLGHQQMVAIAKALSVEARLIVMDEPTSSLTDQEIEYLFEIIQDLKRRGIAVIYVSHRLQEIFAIADVISVLRDGEYIGMRNVADTTEDELIRMIVGRSVEFEIHQRKPPLDEIALSVESISKKGAFEDISFDIHRGEVLAMSGLVGSGRTDVARAIYGVDRIDSGQITVFSQPVEFNSPRAAIREGIGMVPEDRKKQGFVPQQSVMANITLANILDYCRSGFIQAREERKSARHHVERLDIKTPSLNQQVAFLSGGNQQKVVLAKTLDTGAEIYILDEPTSGIDVGAKAEIRNLINELAEQSRAILLISSEIPEVLALSNRILVMREGRLVGELAQETATPEQIMKLSVGENESKNET